MNDVLGHPLEVGTLVLTQPHYSTEYRLVVAVAKVTKKAVYVPIACDYWDGKGFATETRLIRRRPDQMVAIGNQYSYNKRTYPENMI